MCPAMQMLVSKLFISAGNTPTSQTDMYISKAKMQFNVTTTSSSTTSIHRRTAVVSLPPQMSSNGDLPNPVCVIDKRYISPMTTVYVDPVASDSSLAVTRDVSGVESPSNDFVSEQLEKQSNASDSQSNNEEDRDSVLYSDDDYDNEQDVSLFCQHRRHRPKKTRILSRLSGFESLMKFLQGTAGEKYCNLWLDIERAKLAHNSIELQR